MIDHTKLQDKFELSHFFAGKTVLLLIIEKNGKFLLLIIEKDMYIKRKTDAE